jgi:pantothenate kinase
MQYFFNIIVNIHSRRVVDTLSEWLRSVTRNHVGFARVGSNPAGVALFYNAGYGHCAHLSTLSFVCWFIMNIQSTASLSSSFLDESEDLSFHREDILLGNSGSSVLGGEVEPDGALTIPRFPFDEITIGIDIGGTLVKVAFVGHDLLQFAKFDVQDMDQVIAFLKERMKSDAFGMHKTKKIMATGGGSIKYGQLLHSTFPDIEWVRIDEMTSLVKGLFYFIAHIPRESYTFGNVELLTFLGRNPALNIESMSPIYEDSLYSNINSSISDGPNLFPCLLVNIGSGVSILKVTSYNQYERISGTSLGGGTFCGLTHILTGANSFDESLHLADKGDSSHVDLLVGDIYGTDYEKIGLSAQTIASSFGKARSCKNNTSPSNQDIAASILHMITVNIGQIAYLNAKLHQIRRIYFSGYFIRGHLSTMQKLTFAIHFWSKGEMKALFLRHEGYLGAMGSLLSAYEDISTSNPEI